MLFTEVRSRHDISPSILRFPLPPKPSSEPEAQRARLSSSDDVSNSIEKKYFANAYEGIEDLAHDFNTAIAALFHDGSDAEGLVNGDHTRPSIDQRTRDRILNIQNLLNTKAVQLRELAASMEEDDSIRGFGIEQSDRGVGQVLTLRIYTDRVPRHVYSGLQSDPTAHIDGKTLPNGFDLIGPTPIDAHADPGRKVRTFGDVFRPKRNSKTLELPRTGLPTLSRQPKIDSHLDALFQRITPGYNHDYAFAKVPTGEWLSYGGGSPAVSTHQHQGDEMTDNIWGSEKTQFGRLFQTAYTSFAPAYDKSTAIVPQKARSAKWWDQIGSALFASTLLPEYRDHEISKDSDLADTTTELSDLDIDPALFADLEVDPPSTVGSQTVDEMLSEVSDLIETLYSYQRNRQLEDSRLRSTTDPSEPEVDMYEILKNQLSLVVASLPPFAVSKLNGIQLRELNISTNIVLEPTDFQGSSESDGYIVKRPVPAAAAPIPPAARPTVSTPAPIRPNNFQTQHNVTLANYNARARVYNAASGTPNYGTNTPNDAYQTPRSQGTPAQPQYLPRPYQQNATPAYQPPTSIQAFQRPTQNGYNNYRSGTAQTPSSFVQRPSQPGYQQRAQDRDSASLATYGRSTSPQTPVQAATATYQNSIYPRSASPQKPVVNGQTPAYSPTRAYQTPQQPQPQQARPSYSPRPVSAHSTNQASVTANANANADTPRLSSTDMAQRERIGQLKQQLESRQGSAGSPPPPTPGYAGANMNARYDGAADGTGEREQQVKREPSTPAATMTT